jgi:hypothetical protein
MPCCGCGSSDEKPTASVAARTAAIPPEQVKAVDDNGAAKTVHAEEKDERTKKRDCGCQC